MLTDEHEHAMKVWREADRAGEDAYVEAVETGTTAVEAHEAGNQAAAAVIAADRAGLVAEIERLAQAWKVQHKEKMKERAEARLWFERAQKWAEENVRLREVAITLHGALAAHTCYGCPACHGDCSSANPPMMFCPTAQAQAAYFMFDRAALKGTRHDADA